MLTRFYVFFAIWVLLIGLVISPVLAKSWQCPEIPGALPIQFKKGPDISYGKLRGLDFRSLGGILEKLYIIEIDPRFYSAEIVIPADKSSATTTPALIQQVNGVAGINGGFWHKIGWFVVTPDGLLKIGDQLIGDALLPSPTIGWTSSGEVMFGDVGTQYSFELVDEPKIQIPLLHDTWVPWEDLRHIKVESDVIRGVGDLRQHITGEGTEYSIDPTFAGDLRPYVGKRVKKNVDLVAFECLQNNQDWNRMNFAISGNLTIVRNGKAVELEDYQLAPIAGSLTGSRTGLCVNQTGRLNLLATGGMTIKAFAEGAVKAGCIYAINLDGGPSTAMFFDGKSIIVGGQIAGLISLLSKGILTPLQQLVPTFVAPYLFSRAIHNAIVVVEKKKS